jgi:hypothetical protein
LPDAVDRSQDGISVHASTGCDQVSWELYGAGILKFLRGAKSRRFPDIPHPFR